MRKLTEAEAANVAKQLKARRKTLLKRSTVTSGDVRRALRHERNAGGDQRERKPGIFR